MLKFRLTQTRSRVDAYFDDESTLRNELLGSFLNDMYGQEDLYLGEIAKAEAGETILDLYNNSIHAYLFPDLVVVEDMWDPSLEDEAAEGPRRCTILSLTEARQLIEDWVQAQNRWYAERGAASKLGSVAG